MHNIYKKNIYKLLIVQFFMSFYMVQVIQTIYMSANHITLIQIGIVYAIYQFSKLTFEVPTGFIADKYGRKISTILGLISLVISLLLVVINKSFYCFIIAAFIQGISYTFISGASDALLIDSIYSANEKSNFEKYNAKGRALTYIAVFASSTLGGFIAERSLLYVYVATIILQIIPIIILTFFVIEPPYKNEKIEKIKAIPVLKFIFNNKMSMWMLSIDVIISIALIPIEAHYFNYFKTIGINEDLSGLIYGIQYLASSLVGLIIYKYIVNLIGNKIIIFFPPLMMLSIFAFGCIPNFFAKIFFYFLGLLLLCCFSPTKSLLLHDTLESTYRASILSFQSICMSSLAFVFQPLFGYMADKKGYSTAMDLLSIISLVLMIIACIKIRKLLILNKKYSNSNRKVNYARQ